jgi:hypothetical protein
MKNYKQSRQWPVTMVVECKIVVSDIIDLLIYIDNNCRKIINLSGYGTGWYGMGSRPSKTVHIKT